MNVWKRIYKPVCTRGFSLREIAILVAILLIFAVILVPQLFFTGSNRSRVSRVKSDMRSLATGLEAYYVDHNAYPAMAHGAEGINAKFGPGCGAYMTSTFRLRNYRNQTTQLKTLTTPVAYVTGYFPDPFADTKGSYFGYRQYPFTWLLISYGPDRDENTTVGDHFNTVPSIKLTSGGLDLNFESSFNVNVAQPSMQYLGVGKGRGSGQALHYDPSNGIISEGDIVRVKN